MYYVKIQDGKIINKGYKTVEALSPDEGTDIVTEDIYNQLTGLLPILQKTIRKQYLCYTSPSEPTNTASRQAQRTG